MLQQQRDEFKNAAKLRPVEETPLALIIDSPWIPGYLGIHHLDYYPDPGVWLRANLQVARDFPDVIPFPSWWIEYGMAIEPSAAGVRVSFFPDQPPGLSPALYRLEDAGLLSPIGPWRDGFMALALHRCRREKQRIFDAGYTIPVVAARGPLCTASFVYGLDNLMAAVVEDPEGVDRLLAYLTEGTIAWLKAQAEAAGPCVEGIFVLDDVPGASSRGACTCGSPRPV